MLGLAVVAAGGLMLLIHVVIGRQITLQNEDNNYLKNEDQFAILYIII